jgi:hypothetical protein
VCVCVCVCVCVFAQPSGSGTPLPQLAACLFCAISSPSPFLPTTGYRKRQKRQSTDVNSPSLYSLASLQATAGTARPRADRHTGNDFTFHRDPK